jgi:hypothetical protein
MFSLVIILTRLRYWKMQNANSHVEQQHNIFSHILQCRSKQTFYTTMYHLCPYQWLHSLRIRCMAACLLGLWVDPCWRHGCLSVVRVVCCQVEVSAMSSSLVQRSLVSIIVCDPETSTMRWHRPNLGCCTKEKKSAIYKCYKSHWDVWEWDRAERLDRYILSATVKNKQCCLRSLTVWQNTPKNLMHIYPIISTQHRGRLHSATSLQTVNGITHCCKDLYLIQGEWQQYFHHAKVAYISSRRSYFKVNMYHLSQCSINFHLVYLTLTASLNVSCPCGWIRTASFSVKTLLYHLANQLHVSITGFE